MFGDCRQARADAAQGLKLERGRASLPRAALALALCGETNQVKPLIDELTKRYPEDTLINSIWLPAIRAAIELQRGNATQAIEQLQTTSRYEAAAEFWPQYLRGQAYLKLAQARKRRRNFKRFSITAAKRRCRRCIRSLISVSRAGHRWPAMWREAKSLGRFLRRLEGCRSGNSDSDSGAEGI